MALYRTSSEPVSAEEVADFLRKHIDEKYTITVKKADKSGVSKFFTGNKADTVRIKKNGYHGVAIALTSDETGKLVLSTYFYNRAGFVGVGR